MLDDAAKTAHARLIEASWSKIRESNRLLKNCAHCGSHASSRPDVAHEEPRLARPIGSIIFSQRDGHVWASWSDAADQVNLGLTEGVEEMMRDYLAQTAIAKRLLRTGSRAG